MNKGWLFALIVIAVGTGLFFWLGGMPEQEPTPLEEPPAVTNTYSSDELSVVFEYPKNYMLQTFEQGTGERMWTTLTLIDTEILRSAIENGASEGPPSIAIEVFANLEEYTAEEWIKGMSYSNYKLSPDGVLMPTTIGGESALRYRHSGLFEADAVVAVHGGKVYKFSVTWLTEDDQNRVDFENIILSSITFK